MRIADWVSLEKGPQREVSAEIDGYRLWYRLPPDHPVERSGDPFLAAAIVPAMSAAEAVEVDPAMPVSPKLLAELAVLQEIHHSWNPALKIVPVRAAVRASAPRASGVLSFFSAGVDSTYTLLKHLDEISHLVFIQGFDFFADGESGRGFTTADISDLAQLGHKLAVRADPISSFLRDRLSAGSARLLAEYQASRARPDLLEGSLATDLDSLIGGPAFYEPRRFARVTLRPETRRLLETGAGDADPRRLNRQLLEDAYPLEIAREKSSIYPQAVERNSRFAAALGKTLVAVETNHFPFGYRYNLSRNLSQGGALASVAHLLGFPRTLIPSSYAYHQLFPLGSHPLVDPLWSTEGVEIVHDGGEATRVDKIRTIAGEPRALANLRVCFRDMNVNCGRCLKCLRTMIPLALLGAADVPFPPLPPTKDISKMRITGAIEKSFFQDNLDLAKTSGDVRLLRALEACLRRYERQSLVKEVDRVLLGGRIKRIRQRRAGSGADLQRIDTTAPAP